MLKHTTGTTRCTTGRRVGHCWQTSQPVSNTVPYTPCANGVIVCASSMCTDSAWWLHSTCNRFSHVRQTNKQKRMEEQHPRSIRSVSLYNTNKQIQTAVPSLLLSARGSCCCPLSGTIVSRGVATRRPLELRLYHPAVRARQRERRRRSRPTPTRLRRPRPGSQEKWGRMAPFPRGK